MVSALVAKHPHHTLICGGDFIARWIIGHQDSGEAGHGLDPRCRTPSPAAVLLPRKGGGDFIAKTAGRGIGNLERLVLGPEVVVVFAIATIDAARSHNGFRF